MSQQNLFIWFEFFGTVWQWDICPGKKSLKKKWIMYHIMIRIIFTIVGQLDNCPSKKVWKKNWIM